MNTYIDFPQYTQTHRYTQYTDILAGIRAADNHQKLYVFKLAQFPVI